MSHKTAADGMWVSHSKLVLEPDRFYADTRSRGGGALLTMCCSVSSHLDASGKINGSIAPT
jgi:hypothetical protein